MTSSTATDERSQGAQLFDCRGDLPRLLDELVKLISQIECLELGVELFPGVAHPARAGRLEIAARPRDERFTGAGADECDASRRLFNLRVGNEAHRPILLDQAASVGNLQGLRACLHGYPVALAHV